MAELLPCPFCGSDRVIVGQCKAGHVLKKYHGGYFAGCLDCHITTSIYPVVKTRSPLLNEVKKQEAEQRAIDDWNARTPQETESLLNIISHKEAEIERLQNIIKELAED